MNPTMRALPIAAITLLVLVSAAARGDGEVPGAGVVFVAPTVAKAMLYEKPDPGSPVISTPSAGARLVCRAHLEAGGSITWYKIQTPTGKLAWVAAASVAASRPGELPPAKAMKLFDSGHSTGAATASTAAARGLDGRARSYAAGKTELEAALKNFESLEITVLEQFDDPTLPAFKQDGNYKDVTNPNRSAHAAKLKAELQ